MKKRSDYKLTDEQSKMAADNIKLYWKFIRANLQRLPGIEQEIFCDMIMAAYLSGVKNYNPTKGTLGTYVYHAMITDQRRWWEKWNTQVDRRKRTVTLDHAVHVTINPESKVDPDSLRVLMRRSRITRRDEVILKGRLIEGKTLQNLGDRFNICRERVRQLQATAMRRLQKHLGDDKIEHYKI